MEDVEKLYRYCRKNNIDFNYIESNQFTSVIFSKNETLFSYCYDKEKKEILYIHVDGVSHNSVDLALKDFENYVLLRGRLSLY